MIPGEIIISDEELEINSGSEAIEVEVSNTGDRPIQVGSHYHFFETNEALKFSREKARGMRLDIISGTAIRFEPGQTKTVNLISFHGDRKVYGFNKKIMGDLYWRRKFLEKSMQAFLGQQLETE